MRTLTTHQNSRRGRRGPPAASGSFDQVKTAINSAQIHTAKDFGPNGHHSSASRVRARQERIQPDNTRASAVYCLEVKPTWERLAFAPDGGQAQMQSKVVDGTLELPSPRKAKNLRHRPGSRDPPDPERVRPGPPGCDNSTRSSSRGRHEGVQSGAQGTTVSCSTTTLGVASITRP